MTGPTGSRRPGASLLATSRPRSQMKAGRMQSPTSWWRATRRRNGNRCARTGRTPGRNGDKRRTLSANGAYRDFFSATRRTLMSRVDTYDQPTFPAHAPSGQPLGDVLVCTSPGT
jgi:hypothetical protein